MDIQQLITSVEQEDLRISLSESVSRWKNDQSDIYALYKTLKKWHGSVWFENDESHAEFHSFLEKFKKKSIDGIGGMTVNERLFHFGLLEEWDESDRINQDRIRIKLRASY